MRQRLRRPSPLITTHILFPLSPPHEPLTSQLTHSSFITIHSFFTTHSFFITTQHTLSPSPLNTLFLHHHSVHSLLLHHHSSHSFSITSHLTSLTHSFSITTHLLPPSPPHKPLTSPLTHSLTPSPKLLKDLPTHPNTTAMAPSPPPSKFAYDIVSVLPPRRAE
ncbi:hypothetical protein Pcinc_044465 [Petrolisthes cinctipes]|uniref:Uncharacterized protein n=1 Tax=Petrolisthes cinctipes TaxID=88211 RepID=A0AAE1EEC5_PETCI|nr:hypothetical protein Pcinc_044465 [Petrolisthes cinctipes]